MSKIVTVLAIADGIEANLLDKHLKEKNIPFNIISNVNTVYDGIFKIQNGWGYLEAPEEFKEEILNIKKELSEGEQVEDEENPPVIPDENVSRPKRSLAQRLKSLFITLVILGGAFLVYLVMIALIRR